MDQLEIISGGSVLVANGKVAEVGREVSEPRGARVLNLRGKALLMPGFVDSHTHAVFAGTREEEYDLRCRGSSYQEIARRGGGILSSVRRVRDASLEALSDSVRPHLLALLQHGTTTAEVKSGYGLTTEDEVKMLRAVRLLERQLSLNLVPTFLGAHALPEEYAHRREDFVELVCSDMIPCVAAERLARFCDVFCDEGFFRVDEARRILARAREAGLGLKIHAEQLAHSGGARLAAELNAVSADHLEHVIEDDIRALAGAGVIATLLPGLAISPGAKRLPPARRLIEAGVPVAVATDFNPGTCMMPSMQLAVALACSHLGMTPAEAITAATVNAAYAAGCGPEAGSIEPGKRADLVILGLTDYRQLPYYFGVNHCAMVIVNGQEAVRLKTLE